MSGLGMLSQGLAGAAGVIGQQAQGDIVQNRKSDLMRQEADINEQMRLRLMERQESLRQAGALADVTGPLGEAKLGYRGKEKAQDIDAAVNQEHAMIGVRQEAAIAANDTTTALAKKNAADPDYLKSFGDLKLADPEVRARIASVGAAAGASVAQTKMLTEQLKQLSEVGKVTAAIHGLQGQLASAKTEQDRNALQQQITDMGFTGKSTKDFLGVAERAMTDGNAALRVLNDPIADPEAKDAARAQLRRANDFATKAAQLAGIKVDDKPKITEADAHAQAQAAIAGGAPVEAVNARLKAAGFGPAPVRGRQGLGAKTPVPQPTGMLSSMDGIAFAGDGYRVNGAMYPTLPAAQTARDRAKAEANPMSQSINKYGDN